MKRAQKLVPANYLIAYIAVPNEEITSWRK